MQAADVQPMQSMRSIASGMKEWKSRVALTASCLCTLQYRSPWGEVRIGKILEDLDSLSALIAFDHWSVRGGSTSATRPDRPQSQQTLIEVPCCFKLHASVQVARGAQP
jgi:hypothetical protein